MGFEGDPIVLFLWLRKWINPVWEGKDYGCFSLVYWSYAAKANFQQQY
jgi:hypothetical protein